MGPLEQRLEREAGRMGWRLRWKREPSRAYPSLTCTELDIFDGKRLVTNGGPFAVIAGGRDPEAVAARARETIAGMILNILLRRGAGTI
jgi:hypothetical protein